MALTIKSHNGTDYGSIVGSSSKPLVVQTRQDLLNLIWGNGGNSPATIQFHSDGGHGWLQVPKKLCQQLGIVSKITRYSYERGEYYYLEEDCDLSTFVVALGIGGEDRTMMQVFWELCPQNDTDDSPIRSYRHVEG